MKVDEVMAVREEYLRLRDEFDAAQKNYRTCVSRFFEDRYGIRRGDVVVGVRTMPDGRPRSEDVVVSYFDFDGDDFERGVPTVAGYPIMKFGRSADRRKYRPGDWFAKSDHEAIDRRIGGNFWRGGQDEAVR